MSKARQRRKLRGILVQDLYDDTCVSRRADRIYNWVAVAHPPVKHRPALTHWKNVPMKRRLRLHVARRQLHEAREVATTRSFVDV